MKLDAAFVLQTALSLYDDFCAQRNKLSSRREMQLRYLTAVHYPLPRFLLLLQAAQLPLQCEPHDPKSDAGRETFQRCNIVVSFS